jgi:predicted membrane-bound mannosyltransferase/sugar lactone lactonase YvrE
MTTDENRSSWLDRPLSSILPPLNTETILFGVIIILAVVSRFYDLGARVMSHDESLHTYYSWNLYRGNGFQHTPLMHGPFQFHIIALCYSLFGDSDFTARIPAALFSIATVLMMWKYRKYLGRAGALIAAFLLVISPYMLYYGRYTRNEAIVAFLGVLTLYSILRYQETGQNRYLYLLTIATVIHFTTKETSFIYTAQALLFLAFLFLSNIIRRPWVNASLLQPFIITIGIAVLLTCLAIGGIMIFDKQAGINSAETVQPVIPDQPSPLATPGSAGLMALTSSQFAILSLVFLAAILFIGAIFLLVKGLTWECIRNERSFDMLIVLGTMILPHLSAFPVKLLMNWDPLDYSQAGLLHTAIFLIPLAAIAIAIGIWWNPRVWLVNFIIFYGIFTVFFTTIFTNGQGFFTGLVGSLGYWLEQQGVERGSQPWYYYILIQLPMYEYLPVIGGLLAMIGGLFGVKPPTSIPGGSKAETPDSQSSQSAPTFALLVWWALSSLVAYTIAGEKMPWLTVHITLPLILLSGWSIGKLIEKTDWTKIRAQKGILIVLLLFVFITSVLGAIGSLLGTQPPFQGKELVQLQATATFLFAAITAAASAGGLIYLTKDWESAQFSRMLGIVFLGLLATMTTRTSIMANYINYDQANEYLVYAHSARGVKDVLEQVEEISRRTTGGLALSVAFDDAVSWPYTWYLRNYTKQHFFGANPTRDVKNDPVIIVGASNYGKIEPLVGQAFYRFDYVRMIWPNQDYFNLTWERISNALNNPQMRQAIFDIWLNRDFKKYAEVTGQQTTTPENWQPSDRMRLYIRKDIAAQIWKYGAGAATTEEIMADPYEKGRVKLSPDLVLGGAGSEPGQFQAPRAVSVGPNNSLYVADSYNHRIQHLTEDGAVLQTWGSFADIAAGPAPEGTFNQPWGVAYSPVNEAVYVADTWNHRIQKFTPDGKFLTMWGYFGQAENPEAFWGPRGIAVDKSGRVYVTDTGNKRVVIFNKDGQYLAQFGVPGSNLGELDEPVGIAVDDIGNIYVVDTWNQRVQVFTPDASFINFTATTSWEISGWYGESLENKPFIAIDAKQNVFVTDPEAYRVLEFNSAGQFIRTWGEYATDAEGFGLTCGITVDAQGRVWVSDPGNQRLLRFTMPEGQ